MRVITCFSYKGGAGRTTAAANIAAALSSTTENVGSIDTPLARKVAIIDLDVFSAGTHRVFEINNAQIQKFAPCVQDYLRDQMAPSTYADEGGLTLAHPLMKNFKVKRGGDRNCHPGLTLFPAKPDPGARFVVQKQHENVLIELLMELESPARGYDYVILDGESGTRSMADIGLRLADVVIMFFRLTWQHIEGTLNTADDFLKKTQQKPFYLIPTCVPLIDQDDNVYKDEAPGLTELIQMTRMIPEASSLNVFARDHHESAGHFWADVAGPGRLCIHDSLWLKGEERVIVFEASARNDRAAVDLYRIAVELDRLHYPSQ
jgi:cellulose biosynthesis protein BcsQ